MKKKFEIIYDDEAILVLDKAADILTIPDRFKPEIFNLYNWLELQYSQIFVVHRLDKETSGLLVFGKTEEAHKSLSQQFESRSVSKIYSVLVEGVLHEMEGRIDQPIGKHPSKPGKMIVSAKGKPSVTEYKVLEHFKNYSLVEADIKTGRTHQIRVHFQSLGYPLAVDKLYGRNDAFFLSKVKSKYNRGKGKEERSLMSRTSLHASQLTINHPNTGEQMTFESSLPKDFNAVLKQLRKWGGVRK